MKFVRIRVLKERVVIFDAAGRRAGGMKTWMKIHRVSLCCVKCSNLPTYKGWVAYTLPAFTMYPDKGLLHVSLHRPTDV